MIESQMQGHIREYAEDGIQQKVRLSNLLNDLNNQEHKTRERVIDQTELIRILKGKGVPNEKVQYVEQRKEKDEIVLENIQSYVQNTEQELDLATLSLNSHMEELSAIEINAGGFVTHPIGTGKGAILDKNNMVVKFEPEGHIEIPIGVRLNSWRDSSQLTITKIERG